MDVVSCAWSRAVSRVPFPNWRSGMNGRAIAGNPDDDGHLSPWQEAVGLWTAMRLLRRHAAIDHQFRAGDAG
jgi:hypothetical protein